MLAAMPDAIAYVAAMGWSSFFVDSPDAALPLMMLAALSAVLRWVAALSGVLRGRVACASMVCAAIFWDGCRGVARLGLGPVIVAFWGVFGGPLGPLGPDCFQPYPGAGRAGCCDRDGCDGLGCDKEVLPGRNQLFVSSWCRSFWWELGLSAAQAPNMSGSRSSLTMSRSPRARWWIVRAGTCSTSWRRLAGGVGTSTSSCTTCLNTVSRRGSGWRNVIFGMVVLVRWIVRAGTFSTFHVWLSSGNGTSISFCTWCSSTGKGRA